MESNSKLTLLDLPRHKGVKIYADEISDGSTYIVFEHIDGMYSVCTTEKGGYIHLAVLTPLVPYEDGYKIYDQPH